jgi:hypothetical protein
MPVIILLIILYVIIRVLQSNQSAGTLQHQGTRRGTPTPPAGQRRTHSPKMEDMMSGVRLNPRTGEWETRR